MPELKRHFTGQFKRDLKRARKRGKDIDNLKAVMSALNRGEPLAARYRDHKLSGNYVGRRECRIEPDWLLIYKLDLEAGWMIYERTGTHSDLFRK